MDTQANDHSPPLVGPRGFLHRSSLKTEDESVGNLLAKHVLDPGTLTSHLFPQHRMACYLMARHEMNIKYHETIFHGKDECVDGNACSFLGLERIDCSIGITKSLRSNTSEHRYIMACYTIYIIYLD